MPAMRVECDSRLLMKNEILLREQDHPNNICGLFLVNDERQENTKKSCLIIMVNLETTIDSMLDKFFTSCIYCKEQNRISTGFLV